MLYWININGVSVMVCSSLVKPGVSEWSLMKEKFTAFSGMELTCKRKCECLCFLFTMYFEVVP